MSQQVRHLVRKELCCDYGREFLTADEMYRNGDSGDITLCGGFHIQNSGLPRIGRLSAHTLPDTPSHRHSLCWKQLWLRCRAWVPAHSAPPNVDPAASTTPFPSEVGLFRLRNRDTPRPRSRCPYFQTARTYIERFALYGPFPSRYPLEIHAKPLPTLSLNARCPLSQPA